MGRPRNQIVYDKSVVHLTSRCHNQSFYLQDSSTKDSMIDLWRKHKDKYQIKIVEFVIMDNHFHMSVYAPDQASLSGFMQATNSKMAMQVNQKFNKKNQVFADRFRSPTIEDPKYFETVIQYIWNNPVKAGMIDLKHITKYRHCSLYYRIRGKDCRGLLCSYDELAELSPDIVPDRPEGQMAYIKKLLDQLRDVICNNVTNLLAQLFKNAEAVFEHLHTIGTMSQVKARRRLIFHKHPPALASP